MLRQQHSASTALENVWNRDIGNEDISIIEEFGLQGWNLDDPEDYHPHVTVRDLFLSFGQQQVLWITENAEVMENCPLKPHGMKQFVLMFSRLETINNMKWNCRAIIFALILGYLLPIIVSGFCERLKKVKLYGHVETTVMLRQNSKLKIRANVTSKAEKNKI